MNKVNVRELLDLISDKNVNHDYRWLKIIDEVFGHEIKSLELNFEGLVAYLPLVSVKSCLFGNSLISVPYINGGGIIFNSEEAKNQLISELKKSAADYDYIELRHEVQQSDLDNDFLLSKNKVSFVLDLPQSPDQLFQSFSAKLRSQIKRPERAGAECKMFRGLEITEKELEEFYLVFSLHMRDLGTPVYPKKFFKKVITEFKDQAVLSLVSLNNKITSVGLSIIDNKKAEIIWAASLKKYHKESVNMMLYWKTMEFFSGQGITKFDFGRCSKNSGTYNFKKQWGAKEKQLYWYYLTKTGELPQANPENKKFKLAISLWKKLPLPIANWLGPVLTKHLP